MPKTRHWKIPYPLPADLEQRWERPPLRDHLRSGEVPLWTDLAITGLAGHPWVSNRPLFGSAMWDVAISEQRLVGVRYLLNPMGKRASRVFLFDEVDRCELRFHTFANSVILALHTPATKWNLKMFRMRYDYVGAERAMRKAHPDLVVKGIPGRG